MTYRLFNFVFLNNHHVPEVQQMLSNPEYHGLMKFLSVSQCESCDNEKYCEKERRSHVLGVGFVRKYLFSMTTGNGNIYSV